MTTRAEHGHGWVVASASVVGIVGLWLITAALLWVGWAVRADRRHARSHEASYTAADADALRFAAELHTSLKPDAPCPTLDDLVGVGLLSSRARLTDAWGRRFRVTCSAGNVIVESAGRDEHFGTRDDIR